MDETVASTKYSKGVYLNFTSMHGIRTVVDKIRELAKLRVPRDKIPPLTWFKDVADLKNPLDLGLRELPFSVYLISGNAGSGKSTCIQTLNEAMDCLITGSTRVAAQNVYAKLSSAYTSRPINTIFHEFGFRGNHIQAQLGKYHYMFTSNPPLIEELQKRDIVYYWEVLCDITKRTIGNFGETGRAEFETIRTIEQLLCKETGSLTEFTFSVYGSLPSFARTNVIVIDEAGLLGRHMLTAVVYCWWMINAMYRTTQYANGSKPVIVCVGSPTQTDSLESKFEHNSLRCHVKSSENVLTYLICNRSLRNYVSLSDNWAIFINNKRCLEPEFGDLMKILEYGLPITEEHERLVDKFVVPDAYINNPSNLPGWTRLYSSHREVSAYMARLHAHLKVSGDKQFVVFTLPSHVFVRLKAFEDYRNVTCQNSLSLEKWLMANSSRINNYSQSQDHDAGKTRCEIHREYDVAIANYDVTYVLNSQIAVTTRLRKLVFGFSGTYESFEAMLKDDTFINTQGETSVEYAYRFLSSLLFNGLIHFYNYLQQRGLDNDKVNEAYDRMAAATMEILPSGSISNTDREIAKAVRVSRIEGEETFDFSSLGKPRAKNYDDAEDDAIFSALNENMIDLLYCNYNFERPETATQIHAQFAILKSVFCSRYALFSELFGETFRKATFNTYVDNVSFRGCEMFTGNINGGLLSLALQTDSYILMGYTRTYVKAFQDELIKRSLHPGTLALIREMAIPLMVLKDQRGFVSVLNLNISDFVESVDDKELSMATSVDYGISSKLAMTIARSQGLSLDKVAICFSRNNLRLNSVYVAMSRVISSEFLRMNVNPLRERHERDDKISEHILAALRDPSVHIVY
ncbi:helicase-primase helicase subunit [Spheniscid alphaherpesvirus 1]|uniref:Helicase-primase helicase subunit n=1 Tax=Spheniscid alphaherpesvirus 1 TaxID=2560777 RepID=A0A1R3T461_9ALPH|nr:helicase-primase helicase subunit [Spheniscid alphaherpesvirus 1]SCO83600.1 helicase-primase helicase subunit [Spheniscid alphaherpesvirus 1]